MAKLSREIENQKGIEHGYKKLASAIVNQAVRDYKRASGNAYGRELKRDVVRFIKSPFFLLLTNVDPDYLLRTLDHKEEEGSIKQIMEKYGVSQRTAYRIRNGR